MTLPLETTKPRGTLESQLEELLGSSTMGVISGAFRRMEIAEDEIAAAKTRWPLQAHGLHQAFRILVPSSLIQELSDDVYRSHCRQLLERVAAGASERDLDAPTRAELCGAFAALSLAAPLSHDYTAAYRQVLEEALPGAVTALDLPAIRESWDGRTEEVLSAVRRKIAAETRRPR